jgi:PAS domain S-box-containing protein
MLEPRRATVWEPPRKGGSSLRRIGALCAAAAALLVAQTLVGIGHLGRHVGGVLGVLDGLVLLAVPLAIGLLVVALLRLVGRELEERRHAERVLRESEEVFRQLAENVREVFYVCEWPAGGLIFVSPAFFHVWGRPRGEAFSFREEWIDSIEAEDRPRVREAWRAVGGGPFDVEYRIRRDDGSRVWIHDRAFPVRDAAGEVVRIAGVAEDVTERARGERRFRALVEAAPDAMVIVDRVGQIVQVNGQTERLFGYDRSELLSEPIETLMPERYRQRHEGHRRDFLAAPRLRPMGAGFDLFARRKDGVEFPVEISLSPLETDDGPVVSAAIRDITEVRAAQRQLARHRDALEAANRDLAHSNAELEEFASVASHDLQEPLRKIIAFTELLREDLPEGLPPRAEEDASFIVDAAVRMRGLVNALLALTRTGTTEMAMASVSLEECVKRVLETLDLQIADSGALVTRDALPEVTGDPTLVEALYQNLLSNALKFTRPGEAPRVHLSAEQTPGGELVLGVRDAGIGVDPDRAREIFRPFRRLHSRERYPGTGIGLAIAVKAVARHGGRLWVESPPGEGAHFRFTLPGTGADS